MADDLFRWIDSLFTKERLEGSPPTFMIHRFLASNRDYAPHARVLQSHLRQTPELIIGTWQAALPRGRGAPRGLSYAAAKKGAAAEALTAKMMAVTGERRDIVEGMQAILKMQGKEHKLYGYFGVEPPEAEEPEAGPPSRRGRGKEPPKPKPKAGLFSRPSY